MAGTLVRDMTEGSPMRRVVEFFFPLLFGLLFQQVYNMVDTIVVGKFLGVKALAGVGSTGSLSFLVLGFCIGVCNGFAIPVAQKFGERDYPGLKSFVVNAILLAVTFSLVMTAAVCTLCRTTAPLTGFWLEADNPLLAKCRDMLPVERASGFLYYIHGSGWRELIRGFKYRGAWRTARAMGEWYGRCLKESGLYDGVEVVVPLPLHPVKRCRRGYNQSEYIAEGIASQLGAEVDRRSVRRKRNTESQALKPRRERARNVDEAFAVRRPERLEGRHVLLVDDVFTTGSTMLSCAGEMLRAAPGCRISIAALAVSRRELGVRE